MSIQVPGTGQNISEAQLKGVLQQSGFDDRQVASLMKRLKEDPAFAKKFFQQLMQAMGVDPSQLKKQAQQTGKVAGNDEGKGAGLNAGQEATQTAGLSNDQVGQLAENLTKGMGPGAIEDLRNRLQSKGQLSPALDAHLKTVQVQRQAQADQRAQGIGSHITI